MKNQMWLKKYTELRFVDDILEHKRLHLGNPELWDDKNDSEAIRIYSKSITEDFNILGTCLTKAADRFHFWHIFGKRELGICLWFCREALTADIKKDASLISHSVRYRTTKRLSETSLPQVPFTKRKQYHDEQEFRVLRIKAPAKGPEDKFSFSPLSLKRIYLNPWLPQCCVKHYKDEWKKYTDEAEFGHVSIQQNQSLLKEEWVRKLRESVNN